MRRDDLQSSNHQHYFSSGKREFFILICQTLIRRDDLQSSNHQHYFSSGKREFFILICQTLIICYLARLYDHVHQYGGNNATFSLIIRMFSLLGNEVFISQWWFELWPSNNHDKGYLEFAIKQTFSWAVQWLCTRVIQKLREVGSMYVSGETAHLPLAKPNVLSKARSKC